MRVSFEHNKFIARPTTGNELRQLKRAHFHYEEDTQNWFTTSTEHAAQLREYFSPALKKHIEKACVKVSPWYGRVLVPKEKKLHKHQIDGVHFAMDRNHSYLAFDMGLGKTATAIAIINCLTKRDVHPLHLIVVPPFLVTNWQREIEEWGAGLILRHVRTVEDIVATAGALDILRKHVSAHTVAVVPDSLFIRSDLQYALKLFNYGSIIIDEAQRYLGADSKRTQFLFGPKLGGGLVHKSQKVVLLSGTPMRKGPMDLYPTLKALAWDTIDFLSQHNFGLKYCAAYEQHIGRGRKVWNYKGASNEEILKEKLEDFVLRRELTSCMTELRGLLEERIVVLDGDITKKIMKLEEAVLGGRTAREFLEGRKDQGAISTYRAELAQKKIEVAYDYIKHILDNSDEQVLVFGHHVEPLEKLRDKLDDDYARAALITGSTTKAARDNVTRLFQEGRLRVIVANISTMVGLNLTRATRCVFVESAWNSTDNEQARSRAFRIGQTKKVLVEHLVLANTLDEYVINTVIRKKATIQKIF